jgi:hypothetical protein
LPNQLTHILERMTSTLSGTTNADKARAAKLTLMTVEADLLKVAEDAEVPADGPWRLLAIVSPTGRGFSPAVSALPSPPASDRPFSAPRAR